MTATNCSQIEIEETEDGLAFEEDALGAPKIDVSRGEIAQALMIASMVVMVDEGRDLAFASTMRIFSSAEKCRRVARRMSLVASSAGGFSGLDFCLIFAVCGYDDPEILPS
jgi:hypothetical protein